MLRSEAMSIRQEILRNYPDPRHPARHTSKGLVNRIANIFDDAEIFLGKKNVDRKADFVLPEEDAKMWASLKTKFINN